MPRLALLLAAVFLLSSSWNSLAMNYVEELPSDKDAEAAMVAMADHCDHEESSSLTQDCLNHCAMLMALPASAYQPIPLLTRYSPAEPISGSPISRASHHWRPPSSLS